MGLGDELGGANVGHPDLDRAKALPAQPFSMLSYTFAGRRHTPMLHVTGVVVDPRPRRLLAGATYLGSQGAITGAALLECRGPR